MSATSTPDAVKRQLAFYAKTAGQYDESHGREEHRQAIDLSVIFMRSLGVRSVLDTGCGTGLGMLPLAQGLPEARIHGNDPSPDMLEVARKRGISPESLDCVGSEKMPYADGEFDAVIETGVLHHVPDPNKVLDEMMRVSRLGVFLSDDNYFGSGRRLFVNLIKLGLSATGVLPDLVRLRRHGHLWNESKGDGISWNYSVFSAAEHLARTAAEVIVIPTAGPDRLLRQKAPLVCASHGLVIALKRWPIEYQPKA